MYLTGKWRDVVFSISTGDGVQVVKETGLLVQILLNKIINIEQDRHMENTRKYAANWYGKKFLILTIKGIK